MELGSLVRTGLAAGGVAIFVGHGDGHIALNAVRHPMDIISIMLANHFE